MCAVDAQVMGLLSGTASANVGIPLLVLITPMGSAIATLLVNEQFRNQR